jgi:hypothetical protein
VECSHYYHPYQARNGISLLFTCTPSAPFEARSRLTDFFERTGFGHGPTVTDAIGCASWALVSQPHLNSIQGVSVDCPAAKAESFEITADTQQSPFSLFCNLAFSKDAARKVAYTRNTTTGEMENGLLFPTRLAFLVSTIPIVQTPISRTRRTKSFSSSSL